MSPPLFFSCRALSRGLYFIGLLLLGLQASGAQGKEPLQVVVTDTYINMHTGPGRGYPIFYVIERGETITLLYSKTDWIKVVTHKDKTGWIHWRDMDYTEGTNGEEVLLGIPDRGDYSQRRWELGMGFGEFGKVESIGVHASYRFTNNLAIELELGQATGSSSSSVLYSWGLMHQPFPQWRFSPFFKLGNGLVSINDSDLADQEDSFFMVSAGGYFYYSHRFMIRAEYNNYTTLPSRDENEHIEEWRVGLSAFF